MLPGVEGGDVRAIHRTRVASRRLREVLPVLQLDADVADKLGRRLRKVTERLGVVRELDVLMALLEELGRSGSHLDAPLARVLADVVEERDRARARLMAKLPLTELARLASKLEKVARTLETRDAGTRRPGPPPRSWQWAVEARVARRALTLSSAMSGAGTVYLPDRLHTVRIAVKKLRYAVEVSADIAHMKSTPDLTQLGRVQDILGRLHDLQVLIERVRRVQASLTPPDLRAWRELDALIVSLENDCRRLHGRYMNDRDVLSALCARLLSRTSEVRRQRVKG